MILIKTPTSSEDKQALFNSLQGADQELLPDIGSDGAFLELDDDGIVHLRQINPANVGPINHASNCNPLFGQATDSPILDSPAPSEACSDSTASSAASDSTTNADPIVGTYQRPDITLYDRLQIASYFWDPQRPWGTVTWLAQQYRTSRETIYQIAYRARSGLSASLPGPKSLQIETPSSTLLTLHSKPAPASAGVQKDWTRERIILTSVFPGAVTMRPLEQILQQIPGINSCSDTTIWRTINQAAQNADRILSEVDYEQIKLPLVFVAVDETFFNGYPILLIVEPISLAICAYYIPHDKDRSADSWVALLELLKKEQNLEFIGGLGDAAKAYPKAFKEILENDENFCEDLFHLLYAVNRLVNQLERNAYSALSAVEDLITKWCRGQVSEDKIEKCEKEAMKKVDLYDEFAEIATWIKDGLEMIDLSSGEIRDRQTNEWLLDLAIKEMSKLEHSKVKKMAKRLKNHKNKLLKYLDWLNSYLCEPVSQLHEYLDDQELEQHLINLVARYWRVNHAIEGLKYRTLRPLAESLSQEIEFWTTDEQWLSNWTKNVLQLFGCIQRTSSAVENINSILKPMIRNKKHFGSSQSMEHFVALFALWHNLRRFEEGKRKGKSPFDILGIEMESDDWRTLLGYPPTS